MNTNISTAVRRTFVSALAALALTAVPQLGLAQTVQLTGNDGIWKIDLAKSKFGPGSNTLVIERAGASSDASNATIANTMLVVSNKKVYMATAADAYSSASVSDMNLVQIGEHVRATIDCRMSCQYSHPYTRMTLTFVATGDANGQTSGNILAYTGR